MSTRRYSRSPRQLAVAAGALGAMLVTGAVTGALLIPSGGEAAQAARLHAVELQAERDRAALARLEPRIEAAQAEAAGRAKRVPEPKAPADQAPRNQEGAAKSRPEPRQPERDRAKARPSGSPSPVPAPEAPVAAQPAPTPAPAAPDPKPDSPHVQKDQPEPVTGEFGP